ncbi:hypothetical protein CDAR_513871 [Caerostris darwini]|uniref:Uncharacterized protein n=1 Tax=Caerostris darwini TaxID=1538125 RepID=A0AAV4QXE6_9ARAC|nr:hypothetical protein CDAR_513871 [Caerostris darwini]
MDLTKLLINAGRILNANNQYFVANPNSQSVTYRTHDVNLIRIEMLPPAALYIGKSLRRTDLLVKADTVLRYNKHTLTAEHSATVEACWTHNPKVRRLKPRSDSKEIFCTS